MNDLLKILMGNKKVTIEQAIELLLGCSENPTQFREQFEPIDTGIHIAHAVKSGMCFPYFTTMQLHDKAVVFMLEGKELYNYPLEDFGRDVEKHTSLKYLTDSPCFYFDNKPKIAVQEAELETASSRERIGEFSPVNSYDLGCIVNVNPYGMQTENLSLPDPIDCKGNKIMAVWLKTLVGEEAPFQLESKHYKRFESFLKIPGLQIYYPICKFGDPKEAGEFELERFQKYLTKKVEPKLKKLIDK
ncbi:hypothetical protein GOV03_03895 [Candidatus Woesearchaeota archaeon]|nr:hypothetical protein [Candidatus Woesearchaeota archaeon]